jgi:DNA-binding transcriptional regulator YiaG
VEAIVPAKLEEFGQLDEETLCHKLKVLCFVPENYRMKHRAQFEQTTGYIVTESAAEAEQAAWEVIDNDGNALRESLAQAMAQRKIRQSQLATLFGVAKMTVSRWLRGEKPIPRDRAPLLLRWVEAGTRPSAGELPQRKRNPPSDSKTVTVTLPVTGNDGL